LPAEIFVRNHERRGFVSAPLFFLGVRWQSAAATALSGGQQSSFNRKLSVGQKRRRASLAAAVQDATGFHRLKKKFP
jgi:hypothetical protein